MARTYKAEGRWLANLLQPFFILAALYVFYKIFLSSGMRFDLLLTVAGFFLFLILGVVIPEIIGLLWTNYRRKTKDKRKKQSGTIRPTGLRKTKGSKPRAAGKQLSDEEILRADVNTLSGAEFERLMAMYFRDKGYKVEIVGGSGDHEVDLILSGKEDYKIAVQCKRWSKRSVGNDIVLRLDSGKRIHGCLDAWIITTSNFTRAAKEAAENRRIRLINGLTLHSMLKEWKKQKQIS